MIPGRQRPPSTIQRAGDAREPQPGRRITNANRIMTSAKRPAAATNITHHRVAIEADAGPAGSSVDSGPVQAVNDAAIPK